MLKLKNKTRWLKLLPLATVLKVIAQAVTEFDNKTAHC